VRLDLDCHTSPRRQLTLTALLASTWNAQGVHREELMLQHPGRTMAREYVAESVGWRANLNLTLILICRTAY